MSTFFCKQRTGKRAGSNAAEGKAKIPQPLLVLLSSQTLHGAASFVLEGQSNICRRVSLALVTILHQRIKPTLQYGKNRPVTSCQVLKLKKKKRLASQLKLTLGLLAKGTYFLPPEHAGELFRNKKKIKRAGRRKKGKKNLHTQTYGGTNVHSCCRSKTDRVPDPPSLQQGLHISLRPQQLL